MIVASCSPTLPPDFSHIHTSFYQPWDWTATSVSPLWNRVCFLSFPPVLMWYMYFFFFKDLLLLFCLAHMHSISTFILDLSSILSCSSFMCFVFAYFLPPDLLYFSLFYPWSSFLKDCLVFMLFLHPIEVIFCRVSSAPVDLWLAKLHHTRSICCPGFRLE